MNGANRQPYDPPSTADCQNPNCHVGYPHTHSIVPDPTRPGNWITITQPEVDVPTLVRKLVAAADDYEWGAAEMMLDWDWTPAERVLVEAAVKAVREA